MSEPPRPLNPELFDLTWAAFEVGWNRLQIILAEKRYTGTYWEWPKISYFENGLPDFSESSPFDPAPSNYKRAFGVNQDWEINTNVIPEFQKLLEYARQNEQLTGHFSWKDPPTPDEFFQFSVSYFVETLIDRYMHIVPNEPPTREKFAQIYCPREAYIYQETLSVDVIVPILFLKFDFDKHILGPDAIIERMDDGVQLARYSMRAFTPSINSLVLGAATHALVLKGWSITNRSDLRHSPPFSDLRFYQKPLEQVDSFFAALRVAEGLETGYAQVLLRPIGWVPSYTAYLPSLEGTSVRQHPGRFENYYWIRPVQTVSAKRLDHCSKFFREFSQLENNRLRIAVKRLNRCYLREGEEDSILDATIAMEALLSDDDAQEITHKLAMRIAALSTLAQDHADTPEEIFQAVKKIYQFRSKIVHGSTKTDKGREIALNTTQNVPIVNIALDYLRMLISVLVDHQEYLKPSNFDEGLLLHCSLGGSLGERNSSNSHDDGRTGA